MVAGGNQIYDFTLTLLYIHFDNSFGSWGYLYLVCLSIQTRLGIRLLSVSYLGILETFMTADALKTVSR